MKRDDLMDLIEQHLERGSDFEAAMELLCILVVELKSVVAEIEDGKVEAIEAVKELKGSFEHLLENGFQEPEKAMVKKFITSYVMLCDGILSLK